MILSDFEIIKLASAGMIEPFASSQVREVEVEGHPGMTEIRKTISYGCSSYGYDFRLSQKDFRIFRHIPGTVVNPKNFNPNNLEHVEMQEDKWGKFFIIPAGSYALGVAKEQMHLPEDVIAICTGKSTYARVGIIVNITPVEPSWRGKLTIEISNPGPTDCMVFAEEGIAQLLFFRGNKCLTTYADRGGKYQDQPERVVLAKL